MTPISVKSFIQWIFWSFGLRSCGGVCPSDRTWRRRLLTAVWCRPLKSGSVLFQTNHFLLSESERSYSGSFRKWVQVLLCEEAPWPAGHRFSLCWFKDLSSVVHCVFPPCSCPVWVRRLWSTAGSGGPSCFCTNIPKSLDPTKTSLSNSSVRTSLSLHFKSGSYKVSEHCPSSSVPFCFLVLIKSINSLSRVQMSGRGRSSAWRPTTRGWRERSVSREIWTSRCPRDDD